MRILGPYAVMPRATIARGAFSVAAIEPNAIDSVRQWRNAQTSILRQMKPITAQEQDAYFRTAIWPDKDSASPANILLSFFENDALIGYGGLVHIAWPHKRAEVSFLLDPVHEAQSERRLALLAEFLELLKEFAFGDLGLHRLTTETYGTRAHIMPTLEQAGFVREGILREHVFKDGIAYDAVLHGCLAPR